MLFYAIIGSFLAMSAFLFVLGTSLLRHSGKGAPHEALPVHGAHH